MEYPVFEAIGQALTMMLEPHRLGILALGVVLGLIIGIIPGIGSLAALALLLPFTFTMDTYTAFAFLLGLSAVTSTGYPIPSILFGVPGSSASQATVLDGFPMTKKGEAGRALSAAYMASLLGGLFGAAVLALSLPVMRPIMLHIGSPELLAFTILGISMVSTLSGATPLLGLAAGGLGILLAMIGADPQTGTFRWTMGQLYLWDGLPLIPVVLGLFALPEVCDLLVRRAAISKTTKYSAREGMLKGASDVLSNWWLVIRCSSIGTLVGVIPGLGSSVVDWISYGHAKQTEKGARETFGTGDVRGVIAAESANNAKEGGALIPTIAFGVPGGPAMAILLGAFLMHGLIPGPDMVGKNLPITISMIWSIAVANILGAGLCYIFSGSFAKIATLRYTLILPTVMIVMIVGAFQASRAWGDLYVLLFFGILGWTMKKLKWPRPPLVLGFVLGAIIERYTYVSMMRYGGDWVWRPLVLLLLAVSLLALLRPLYLDIRDSGGLKSMVGKLGQPAFRITDMFTVLFILVVASMMFIASEWHFRAKIVPMIVGCLSIGFASISLFSNVFLKPLEAAGPDGKKVVRMHMDLAMESGDLENREILRRAGTFLAWIVTFMISMALIGLIPTVPLFVTAFMRIEGRERWRFVLPQTVLLPLFIWGVFDNLLNVPWPPSLLGALVPALQIIPSV